MSIKLTDRVPIREIEIETEAKAPDVALSNIATLRPFPENPYGPGDETFLNQLRVCGLYEQFLQKNSEQMNSDLHINGLWSLITADHMNSIESEEFRDILDDLPNRTAPLNLEREQCNDETIREVIAWKNRGYPDNSSNLPTVLRKYRKQFARLIVEDNILYRLFYHDCGRIKHKQYCVPKALWREVLFRLHSSRRVGHLGIQKIIADFRKRFYFPNFTEFFISTIQNCLQCLQLKRVPSKKLKTPLQALSSLKSYPGEMLQIDLVGPLKSPLYHYVLTGVDVFTKYLFAVPLTNGRSETVARELAAIFFVIPICRKHCYLTLAPRSFQT